MDAILASGATALVVGDARGADRIAVEFALTIALPVEVFAAEWNLYGNAAGAIRNQRMLIEGRPDLVLAFPGKASIGTFDMIRRAREEGIEVRIFHGDEEDS
jgi:hypothetical protein